MPRFDPQDFAQRITHVFSETADKVEEHGGIEEAERIREAYRMWEKQGSKLTSSHAMAQHALDTTLLAGAGLDGRLIVLWRRLAEQHGPTVAAPMAPKAELPDVLQTVSPLRLARTIALLIAAPGNPDLKAPGGTKRLADLAALVMWSDAARDPRLPTTLERLSKVVEAAVEDVADAERDPAAPGEPGKRLPATRKRLADVVRWLRDLGEQHSTTLSVQHKNAPWWLRLGGAMIIIVALSQLLAALGEETLGAKPRG